MDELITFKTAQLIVKHNIEINTLFSFTKEGEFKAKRWDKTQIESFPCCTQTTLNKLLMEKYKLYVDIGPVGEGDDYPMYKHSIVDLKDHMSKCKNMLKDMDLTYEEIIKNSFTKFECALEDGLMKAIESINSNVKSETKEIGRPTIL